MSQRKCQEVFLSEVAHQVDWFDPAMDAAGEERIWDAMHPGLDSTTGDHGHSWFDVGAYEIWPASPGWPCSPRPAATWR